MNNIRRVARLEGILATGAQTSVCGGCSYRHTRPVTMELIRQCIGAVQSRPPKLCVCPCCAPDAFLVELSHRHHQEVE